VDASRPSQRAMVGTSMVRTPMTAPYSAAEALARDHLQEMLAVMSEAHQQEVRELQDKVLELGLALKKMKGMAFCADPDMDSAKSEVATEIGLPVANGQALRSLSNRHADGPLVKPPRKSHYKNHAGYLDALQDEGPASPSKKDAAVRVLHDPSENTIGARKAVDKEERAEQIRKEVQSVQTPHRRRFAQLQKREYTEAWLWKGHGSLRATVEHPMFDTICAVMIVINSVLVGFDVEFQTAHDYPEYWVEKASLGCSTFFFLELCVRIWVYRKQFFCGGDHKLWNYFDSVLVFFSIFEFLSDVISGPDGDSPSIGSAMKAMKMLRIARVFRVFRFFKELSLLALMIVDSMKSLMWALLMLSIILYVFAILFTQFAMDYVKSNPTSMAVPELHRQFGSMPVTLYSLLQAMLGGVSWGVASDALLHIHWTTACLFFFYIFFTMLAFLNITTGVFVDNAVETARTQRDFLVQKETELKERYLSELRDLFMEMDEDGSGTVCLDEIQTYFKDPRVQSYFAALGLDSAADTERLFGLLDDDGDGDVSIREFLDGCLRLKGQARSIDVQHLLMEFKKLNRRVDLIFCASPFAKAHL